jgi:hypothetical protein
VEANVASDRREYIMERIVAAAEGAGCSCEAAVL